MRSGQVVADRVQGCRDDHAIHDGDERGSRGQSDHPTLAPGEFPGTHERLLLIADRLVHNRTKKFTPTPLERGPGSSFEHRFRNWRAPALAGRKGSKPETWRARLHTHRLL